MSTLLWKFIYGLSTQAIEKKGEEEEHEPKKYEEENGEKAKENLVKEGTM